MPKLPALAACLSAFAAAWTPHSPPPRAATQTPQLSQETREFVGVDAPTVALTHVRVIDGTGAPALQDQTVIVSGGKIQSVGPASTAKVPEGAKVLDLAGRSVT